GAFAYQIEGVAEEDFDLLALWGMVNTILADQQRRAVYIFLIHTDAPGGEISAKAVVLACRKFQPALHVGDAGHAIALIGDGAVVAKEARETVEDEEGVGRDIRAGDKLDLFGFVAGN